MGVAIKMLELLWLLFFSSFPAFSETYCQFINKFWELGNRSRWQFQLDKFEYSHYLFAE